MADNWFRDLFINEVKGATRGQNTKSDTGTGGSDTPADYNAVDPFSASYVAHKPCYEGKEEIIWGRGVVVNNTDYAVSMLETDDTRLVVGFIEVIMEVSNEPLYELHYKIGDIYEIVNIDVPSRKLYCPEYQSGEIEVNTIHFYLVDTALNEKLGIEQILLAAAKVESDLVITTIYAPLNTEIGKTEEYGICIRTVSENICELPSKFLCIEDSDLPDTITRDSEILSNGKIKESIIPDTITRDSEILSNGKIKESIIPDTITRDSEILSNGKIKESLLPEGSSTSIPYNILSVLDTTTDYDANNYTETGVYKWYERSTSIDAHMTNGPNDYFWPNHLIVFKGVLNSVTQLVWQYYQYAFTFSSTLSASETSTEILKLDYEKCKDKLNSGIYNYGYILEIIAAGGATLRYKHSDGITYCATVVSFNLVSGNSYLKLDKALDVTPDDGASFDITYEHGFFIRHKYNDAWSSWYELPLSPVESES